MASSLGPTVVDILDDDDDDVAAAAAVASPTSSRKRPHGAATSSVDFLDAFSPSPPVSKRGLLAAAPIDLDDTPPAPKRRHSPPVLLLDDDDDAGPSATPCSVVPGDDVSDTPDSVLLRAGFSETPGSAEPRFTGTGMPSLISLDSDNDSDDTMHRESLTKSPSNTAGTTSYGEPLHADLLCEYSTLPVAGVCTENYSPREAKKRQAEEKKKKQQFKQEGVHAYIGREETKEGRESQTNGRKKAKTTEMKAQLAEKKKKEKEVKKWESGKFALKCITADIHSSIVESGSIGGQLVSSFAEKGLSYRVTANSTEGSILWKLNIPDDIADMLSSLEDGCDIVTPASASEEIPYIVIVLQAEEFCDLVNRGLFFNHVQKVRKDYPTFTICYVINKLMSYINKREQSQFKNKPNSDTWRRPPVEKVLCKLATHYANVHSRECRDEAELAEHLVGLTASLAKCKFRKPLTWLSVHANGSIVPKDFIDKKLAKKDTWFKSLIAIPKVSAKQAHAIWKQYRSMRSLLKVYMDPCKTDREKELLLSNLKTENQLGDEGRRVGEKCSTAVYRILMAQDGKVEANVAIGP
ncbi:hypothetical protein ACP70R_010440 [Stipagrostis hirtigluma subsp. patula]